MTQTVMMGDDPFAQRRAVLLAVGKRTLADVAARIIIVSDVVPADGVVVFASRQDAFSCYPNEPVLIIRDWLEGEGPF